MKNKENGNFRPRLQQIVSKAIFLLHSCFGESTPFDGVETWRCLKYCFQLGNYDPTNEPRSNSPLLSLH